jgi:hypothetical protein
MGKRFRFLVARLRKAPKSQSKKMAARLRRFATRMRLRMRRVRHALHVRHELIKAVLEGKLPAANRPVPK